VSHAVTAPRVLGPVRDGVGADDFRDERSAGSAACSRKVMQYQPGHGFFVADVYFLPPERRSDSDRWRFE